jgi:predicted heme/steroid binding protein
LEEIKAYDGEHGNRILIAANGSVYDVTESRMWKDGHHARRHKAGDDLTEYLKDAPHDTSVLDRVEKVGVLASGPETVPMVVRVFTVNAYFNLTGCFLIILVLVLWRW